MGSADIPAGLLNAHQRNRLLVTFKHVDKLLADVESMLTPQRDPLFPQYIPDVSPEKKKTIQQFIAELRSRMVAMLRTLGIPLPGPRIGTLHAVLTNLEYVDMAIEELRPKYMRGYGDVPQAAVPQLNGIADELQASVRKISGQLNQRK